MKRRIFESSVFNFEPDREYRWVVVDLWPNPDRQLDIIGGLQDCNHNHGVKANLCITCGAYVGFMGQEKQILEYYRHIWAFVEQYQNASVMVINTHLVPVEYRPMIFGSPVKAYHGRSLVLSQPDGLFMNLFYHDRDADWAPKGFQVSKKRVVDLVLGWCGSDAVWMNPRVKHRGFTGDIVTGPVGHAELIRGF